MNARIYVIEKKIGNDQEADEAMGLAISYYKRLIPTIKDESSRMKALANPKERILSILDRLGGEMPPKWTP